MPVPAKIYVIEAVGEGQLRFILVTCEMLSPSLMCSSFRRMKREPGQEVYQRP